MLIKSNNRQTISKKAAATKCSRLFAYILCTMKTEMRVLTSARRGSKPFPPLQGFSNGLPVETLQRGEVDLSASLAIMFLSCQKLGSRRRRQYYPQLLRHETLYHNPLILSMFLHVSLVL